MSSNILNKIKNIFLHKKIKIHPLLVKSTQYSLLTPSSEKIIEHVLIQNKLNTCYEADFTFDNKEIMK